MCINQLFSVCAVPRQNHSQVNGSCFKDEFKALITTLPNISAIDDLMLHQLVQMEADGEEENEDYVTEAAAATLLIYAGAEESRLAHAQNRQSNCLHLC
jgi:hypothetical protein